MTTRRGKRMKGLLLGALVVVALLAGFFAAVGVLTILHGSACDRLNEERLSHLEPGHDTAGPGSIYVKGIGPGPPPSELIEYLEAQAAMDKAGCGR